MISKEERLNAFSALIQELNVVLTTIGNQLPGLAERVDQLHAGHVIMAPTTGTTLQSIALSSPTADARSLRIYPYFSQDKDINPELAYAFPGNTQYALYQREYHQIMLNMSCNETLRAMACYLIHELGHSLAAKRRGVAMVEGRDPLPLKIMEEVEMRTFDYKLLLILGGVAYRKLAEQEANRITYLRQRRTLFSVKGKGIALNLCFGEALTPEAQQLRDDAFSCHCELMAMDRFFSPAEAAKRKYQFAAQYIKE